MTCFAWLVEQAGDISDADRGALLEAYAKVSSLVMVPDDASGSRQADIGRIVLEIAKDRAPRDGRGRIDVRRLAIEALRDWMRELGKRTRN
jgi:hypothetical protein